MSVDADRSGRARVWRRSGERVDFSEHRFPNWFLATSLDLLAHLPLRHQPAGRLAAADLGLDPAEPAVVIDLAAAGPESAGVEAYRYLVLSSQLGEIETTLVEMCNKRDGGEARTLADLRGLVLVWHPIEQYLMLTGRTYFKDLTFDDLRRLQFDLETTGLNEDRDRIFMISARDSSGWRQSLDTGSMSEAEIIQRLVEAVRERDPDVLENHNIFAFDLPFLVKRAARLGVRLALGRDGSEPWLESDVADAGERAEPLLRWRVAGREVIDTQHAVRRFGLTAPDMRRFGLKEAARYFGFARSDREYVAGVDVWPTYRSDPDRIRRYAAADVDEVDGLSRRLLPSAFGLASLLPRSYERIAADAGPAARWEPLLVRAYVHAGRAIGAPTQPLQPASAASRSEVFYTGVFGRSVRVVAEPLLARVVSTHRIHAPVDDLELLPTCIEQLLDAPDGRPAMELAMAGPDYLAGSGLFSDAAAASRAVALAGQHLQQLSDELRARGCRVVEQDGDSLLVETPDGWDAAAEHQVALAAEALLPRGVRLRYVGYRAVYVRAPRSSMLLGNDGRLTLRGSGLRPGRLERFGDAFLQRAAPNVLLGEVAAVRLAFLETIHRLRSGQLPLDELCAQVVLHKSPAEYRRGGTREEPYEVVLAAGLRSWRVGQRVRFFRARGGEPRLLQEGDHLTSADADIEHYVQRLTSVYARQFAQAFSREDFNRVFSLPLADAGPADAAVVARELAGVQPIAEPFGTRSAQADPSDVPARPI